MPLTLVFNWEDRFSIFVVSHQRKMSVSNFLVFVTCVKMKWHDGSEKADAEPISWASCQIRKIAGAHAMNVFPATAGKRSRHASRHVRHARAVMHAGIAN